MCYYSNLASNHGLIRLIDSSRNLQANYAISFLFHLDLILHVYKILFRRDSFGILNFVPKQGRSRIMTYHCMNVCPTVAMLQSLFLILDFIVSLNVGLWDHDFRSWSPCSPITSPPSLGIPSLKWHWGLDLGCAPLTMQIMTVVLNAELYSRVWSSV